MCLAKSRAKELSTGTGAVGAQRDERHNSSSRIFLGHRTHKEPGGITQTKKTRGKRKKAGQARLGRPARRGHAGWVDEGIAGKGHSLGKGEANPKSFGIHVPNLSKKLSQSLACWISELWPE